MATDQFTIPPHPISPESPEGDTAPDYIEQAVPTPEIMGPYARIKAVEERSHGYRRTALDIEASRDPSFVENLLGGKRVKVSLEGLIDTESLLGGELFGAGDRFWLGHIGDGLMGAEHLGDWYHVRHQYDQYGRKVGETTLHFETHSDRIIKLHEGRPVEPTLAELETFVRAVELYEMKIRAALYPFDQEIFDLIAEIDDENFVPPASLEERFGKEIVARVNAAYKQSKQ